MFCWVICNQAKLCILFEKDPFKEIENKVLGESSFMFIYGVKADP